MKRSLAVRIGILLALAMGVAAIGPAMAADDDQALLQADRAAFGSGTISAKLNDDVLDPNFTWTDSAGNTRTKTEIVQAIRSGKGPPLQTGSGNHEDATAEPKKASVRTYGVLGLVQTNQGKLYTLRVWVKQDAGWRALVYQAVSIGTPVSEEPGAHACENPCKSVPFRPRNADQREVIGAYQAVESAVTAHDSAAWGRHIAKEFFAVTSNSDRPLDKATRMAGLDHQKVGGIAPFPLVSARMFEFGKAMVMISLQQPEGGLPLHVTRIWFKRNGMWREAYSYQTTIQAGRAAR